MAVVNFSSKLLKETLVTLKEARKLVPPKGISLQTLERWISQGVDGVKLEVCRIGGTRHTSEEAVQRFMEETNRTPEAAPAAIPRLSEAETEQELEKLFGPKKRGPKPNQPR